MHQLELVFRISELLCYTLEKQFGKPDLEYVGIALYMEGIVKLLSCRAKQLGRGPKELPPFLPLNLRMKIFSTFLVNQ